MTYLKKFLLNPDRVRKVPASFSWVDRQFIRAGYLQRLCHEAVLLYFFLIIVSDHQGLSFYGDQNICNHLDLSQQALEQGRRQLVIQGLIAYQSPMYQVLSLGSVRDRDPPTDINAKPMLIKDIMNSSLKGLYTH